MTPSQTLSEEVLRNITFFGPFGDISPLWDNPALRRKIIRHFAEWAVTMQAERGELGVHRIAGVETRGAVWGGMLAEYLGLPFSIVRRGGKLHKGLNPMKQEFVNYKGNSDSLEVSPEHFGEHENVLIVDDWFETGHSAMAATKLIERCGARVIGFCTIVNDTSRNPDAQEFFAKYPVCSLVNLQR